MASSRVISATVMGRMLGDFDRAPAYAGLAEALRVLVTDGRVAVGVRLPSERELSIVLDVSRTTVTRAYAELRDQGYLTSRQGSGSVAAVPTTAAHRADHLLSPSSLTTDGIDLTCAAPAPGPGIHAAYQRAVGELPAYLSGTGYHPSGLPVLREAIAAWYAGRGLPTDPDQVMVVPGALAGVAVAARALVARGDRVVLESPTYPNAIATLTHSGGRLVGSDLGRADAAVDTLLGTLAQTRAAAAYLVPDFHNPTGHLLGDVGRERVGHALRRSGTTAIVDESMAELPLDGDEMPAPMATYAPDAISVGSLSKAFWGGLRVGWIRSPANAVDALFRARLSLDLGVPLLEQLVGADLLAYGADLLAHRQRQLRTSRDAALGALAAELPDWRVRKPAGGLSLWCELPRPSSSALVDRAVAHDVLLAAGPAFAPEGGLDRFLRIPFGQAPHVLTEAITRIGTAWRSTPSLRPVRRGGAPNLVA